MVANGVGIIDPDYAGPDDEVRIQVLNITAADVTVKRGDRLAQGIVLPAPRVTWDETTVAARGDERWLRLHRTLTPPLHRRAPPGASCTSTWTRSTRRSSSGTGPELKGPPRRRRRPAGRARRGRRRQLRGPPVRRPLGDSHVAGGPAVPGPGHRQAGLHEVQGGVRHGLRPVPVGHAAGRAAVARRGLSRRDRERLGRAARHDRGAAAQGGDSRRHRPDGVGRGRAQQVPRQDRLGLAEARRAHRHRARARRALPARARRRRAVGRGSGHRGAAARRTASPA